MSRALSSALHLYFNALQCTVPHCPLLGQPYTISGESAVRRNACLLQPYRLHWAAMGHQWALGRPATLLCNLSKQPQEKQHRP
jgi:hypothetical protein